jgi:xanthine dehydrogenase/oxidase
MGIDLSAHYWLYPETEHPSQYCVYGVCASESIVDVLTGETQILRTDILYDGGQSINGEIDMGQAIGAFVMGMGFWLHEKVRYDPISGECLTTGTWEYKVPLSKDIPVDLRITFLQNHPNPMGVLGSKCIGEPPLCLTPSIAFAVKRAIEAARQEIQMKNQSYFALNSPATVEEIQKLCLVDYTQFTLN